MSRFLAFILLMILSLLLLLLSMVQLIVYRNVFFKQKRSGLNGISFILYKFQSMGQGNGEISPWGKFLRRTSLDELPQLINIVKGDMNFIGPRPLLPEYLELYTEEQYKRHSVKPGLTGWAQVNGRNAISWERQFEMDLYYVQHQSIYLDLKVLAKTFLKVFTSSRSEVDIRKPFNGKN
ncbi:glycosyl transferase possibly involved in lipopolysaccharide synthesis [Owenweeksia hongkongensis DSM 17368]|uniref:Glycosyl transferase possibly involved in lipopolysaccharide synthesis n=1 Tax=Owenweeksia hongkongensis (strain DSM 17368 / CIP 108786 / JCM 12287 / NRRL B-23963 / UST20020801) TaxID=926562 RepID=G8R4V4_OWEHD|nr:sugar transferase [Owenweeksia hongkongensis]AEV34268.1 glycosyl transferase possibly involved in lipopolysaccharide synthesis [Owenweeksia hongkongensis DSM 17368]